MVRLSVLGLWIVVLAVGCQQPAQRLNSPPQGDTVNRSPLQEPFHAMVDNSALADMSVTDIHFAGDTAALSGTGEYRMSKLAKICKAQGGTVRYETQVLDEKLLQDRLKRVEAYLEAAGCDMQKCSARLGMAATANMPAAQAIKAQDTGLPGSEGSDNANGGGRQSLVPKLPGGSGAGAAK
jgi:hypothetical protein